MAEKCKITCLPWSEVQHHHLNGKKRKCTGPRFNIKISSYQYRKSHCGDKTVVRSSYLHNGISYTGKMISLYWIRAQIFIDSQTWPIKGKPCPIPHGHFSLKYLKVIFSWNTQRSFFAWNTEMLYSFEILKCYFLFKYLKVMFTWNTFLNVQRLFSPKMLAADTHISFSCVRRVVFYGYRLLYFQTAIKKLTSYWKRGKHT